MHLKVQKGDPGSTGAGGQAAAGNSHGLRDTSPFHRPSLAQQAARGGVSHLIGHSLLVQADWSIRLVIVLQQQLYDSLRGSIPRQGPTVHRV